MPRRPWFRRLHLHDLIAAIERLRSLNFAGRLREFFKRRPKSSKDDGKPRKATPELLPLTWRNPPSESIGNAVLPLAVTAAAVAATALFADAQAAASEAPLLNAASDSAMREFDT